MSGFGQPTSPDLQNCSERIRFGLGKSSTLMTSSCLRLRKKSGRVPAEICIQSVSVTVERSSLWSSWTWMQRREGNPITSLMCFSIKTVTECRLATSLQSSLRCFSPWTTKEDFSCRSHNVQTLLLDFFHYLEMRPWGRSRWNSLRCCVLRSLNKKKKKKKNSCIFNLTVPRRALATKRMGRCCSVL